MPNNEGEDFLAIKKGGNWDVAQNRTLVLGTKRSRDVEIIRSNKRALLITAAGLELPEASELKVGGSTLPIANPHAADDGLYESKSELSPSTITNTTVIRASQVEPTFSGTSRWRRPNIWGMPKTLTELYSSSGASTVTISDDTPYGTDLGYQLDQVETSVFNRYAIGIPGLNLDMSQSHFYEELTVRVCADWAQGAADDYSVDFWFTCTDKDFDMHKGYYTTSVSGWIVNGFNDHPDPTKTYFGQWLMVVRILETGAEMFERYSAVNLQTTAADVAYKISEWDTNERLVITIEKVNGSLTISMYQEDATGTNRSLIHSMTAIGLENIPFSGNYRPHLRCVVQDGLNGAATDTCFTFKDVHRFTPPYGTVVDGGRLSYSLDSIRGWNTTEAPIPYGQHMEFIFTEIDWSSGDFAVGVATDLTVFRGPTLDTDLQSNIDLQLGFQQPGENHGLLYLYLNSGTGFLELYSSNGGLNTVEKTYTQGDGNQVTSARFVIDTTLIQVYLNGSLWHVYSLFDFTNGTNFYQSTRFMPFALKDSVFPGNLPSCNLRTSVSSIQESLYPFFDSSLIALRNPGDVNFTYTITSPNVLDVTAPLVSLSDKSMWVMDLSPSTTDENHAFTIRNQVTSTTPFYDAGGHSWFGFYLGLVLPATDVNDLDLRYTAEGVLVIVELEDLTTVSLNVWQRDDATKDPWTLHHQKLLILEAPVTTNSSAELYVASRYVELSVPSYGKLTCSRPYSGLPSSPFYPYVLHGTGFSSKFTVGCDVDGVLVNNAVHEYKSSNSSSLLRFPPDAQGLITCSNVVTGQLRTLVSANDNGSLIPSDVSRLVVNSATITDLTLPLLSSLPHDIQFKISDSVSPVWSVNSVTLTCSGGDLVGVEGAGTATYVLNTNQPYIVTSYKSKGRWQIY